MPKTRRHQLLTQALRSGPIASQDDLADMLRRAGESTTQATISRDLRELGALKGPSGYTLAEPTRSQGAAANTPEAPSNSSVLADHVLGVTQAANMVVIHTAPGHASLVAAELDANPPSQAVGTIAGDDTIFIATPNLQAAAELTTLLKQVAALQGVG